MGARRNATPAASAPATATTAGILHPAAFAQRVELVRHPVSDPLGRWVENHWRLTWELPDGASFPTRVLPHPTGNLTVERGRPRPDAGPHRVLLTGVATTRFDVATSGRGWVWGVRFRPGGLAALTGLVAADLTDRTVPAARLLPHEVVTALEPLADGPAAPADEPARARVESALGLLVARADGADTAYDEVLDVVAVMLADRDLIRVEDVVTRCGVPRRRLERLFARYVGVGPKWVLGRYRLHDVVTALDEGYDGSLADLAAQYGWYDQAHFARDFGTLVGMPPSDYRAAAGSTAEGREPNRTSSTATSSSRVGGSTSAKTRSSRSPGDSS